MKVRRVKFDFESSMPVHYLGNNIFSTHFVNSFHIIFPEGERFFIRSLQKVVPDIADKDLLKDIKNFSGQEGTHAHQHMLLWKVLTKQGFSVDEYASFYRTFCYDGIEKIIYKIYGKTYGAKVSVAITAALEHYTSMLAEVVFEHQDNWASLPDEMKHLLFWHAAEEIEHKAVAFDVLRYIDNDYLLRATGMIIATTLLFGFTVAGMGMFLYQDKHKEWSNIPSDFVEFAQTIGHPAFKKFVEQWYKFFDKDFHPSQLENDIYAKTYFEQMTQRYGQSA
jgi:uncharacterized protein